MSHRNLCRSLFRLHVDQRLPGARAIERTHFDWCSLIRWEGKFANVRYWGRLLALVGPESVETPFLPLSARLLVGSIKLDAASLQ